jgi:hypothetical protein
MIADGFKNLLYLVVGAVSTKLVVKTPLQSASY